MNIFLLVCYTLAVPLTGAQWTILNNAATVARSCSIFCHGPILEAVQLSGIFNDSKTFVDMPLTVEPEVALEAFQSRGLNASSTPTELLDFLDTYFLAPGSGDLTEAVPTDWQPNPPLFHRIMAKDNNRSNASSRWVDFAHDLNEIWPSLYRVTGDAAWGRPQRHSLLLRRHGLVLPGGRFRETYYWDTYWIVRGLLLCGMRTTAQGIVENLLQDVVDFGFVPNGGRNYYTNRSQPPFLSLMVVDVLRGTMAATTTTAAVASPAVNLTFASAALPLLKREHAWWTAERSVPSDFAKSAASAGGARVHLSRYYSTQTTPRPESFAEDVATNASAANTARRSIWEGASEVAGFGATTATTTTTTTTDKSSNIFAELAAGAESGWDFSSRWMVGGPCGASPRHPQRAPHDATAAGTKPHETAPPPSSPDSPWPCPDGPWPLSSLRPRSVVPVDLNAVLYRSELAIAWLHELLHRCAPTPSQASNGIHPAADAAAAAAAAASHECMEWLKSDERWLAGGEEGAPPTVSAAAASPDGASYVALARKRRAAMQELMWRPNEGRWVDLELVHGERGSDPPFQQPHPPPTAASSSSSPVPPSIASWSAPLWAGLGRGLPPMDLQRVLDALETDSGLIRAAGAMTTNQVSSEQQWDAPNAWAPLQAMLVHGLAATYAPLAASSGEGRGGGGANVFPPPGKAASAVEQLGQRGLAMADSLANSWLQSNLAGFRESGMMYEKYDARVPGRYGGGGEYAPQSGFGWTNGVALEFILRQHGNLSGLQHVDGAFEIGLFGLLA